jgi:hypothetical protein
MDFETEENADRENYQTLLVRALENAARFSGKERLFIFKRITSGQEHQLKRYVHFSITKEQLDFLLDHIHAKNNTYDTESETEEPDAVPIPVKRRSRPNKKQLKKRVKATPPSESEQDEDCDEIKIPVSRRITFSSDEPFGLFSTNAIDPEPSAENETPEAEDEPVQSPQFMPKSLNPERKHQQPPIISWATESLPRYDVFLKQMCTILNSFKDKASFNRQYYIKFVQEIKRLNEANAECSSNDVTYALELLELTLPQGCLRNTYDTNTFEDLKERAMFREAIGYISMNIRDTFVTERFRSQMSDWMLNE